MAKANYSASSINKVYNILLLSETSEAKYAFIHALYSYSRCSTLNDALNRPITEMPKISFAITDRHGEKVNVVGVDSESMEYPVFNLVLNNITLRLINANTIDFSEGNSEELGNILTHSKMINFVCILFSTLPDLPSLAYQNRIRIVMDNLRGDLVRHTVVVCVNRNNNLTPFDTYVPTASDPLHDVHDLNKAKEQFPVPFDDGKVFGVNIKPLAFVIAKLSKVDLSSEQHICYSHLWNLAAEHIRRLVRLFGNEGNKSGLMIKTFPIANGSVANGSLSTKPVASSSWHDTDDIIPSIRLIPVRIARTLSIKSESSKSTLSSISGSMSVQMSTQTTMSPLEIKRKMRLLIRPLIEALELLQFNIHLLKYYIQIYEENPNNPEVLKSYCSIPKVRKDVVACQQPELVCKSEKCAKFSTLENLCVVSYSQTCQSNLANGHKHLAKSAEVMQQSIGICTVCQCHYRCHMVIKYKCDITAKRIYNQMKNLPIKSDSAILKAAKYNYLHLKDQLRACKSEEADLAIFMASITKELKETPRENGEPAFHKYVYILLIKEMALKDIGADNADIIEALEMFLGHYNAEYLRMIDQMTVFDLEMELAALKRKPIIGPVIADVERVLQS
ncbi:hypothetical protein CHUAL_006897 [Chamberlinius hualienensis]